ncbi:LOW QUALITY PROTEIN: spermatogenesis-associated protein 7 [Rhinichthys klamathensis goyatoka]|uniref:LOW QUALITY PROTEIN: spermatogenesis-associated protein 7 n=1 Tax=Rhinichthys klamathensis goyatoka TaxID=3034132 RepID=UPI0024B630EE|nr:LOW QUALITY PROTEIN: spermatogenesis-associated protein 7 [Rhinichthys klamathensis goyatoka]
MRLQPEFFIMDTKPGFCFGSSGKLMDQYMIKDHMVSHYRKLYSAKAAVDCSVPKSLHSNLKYVDQKRREQLRKDTRSQSRRSDSQRSTRINSRTSCSSKNSRPSVQGGDGAYHYLDQSLMSSPRISTSFHSKQIVYPSQTSGTPANHFRSASELSSRSPNPQWQDAGPSCATSASQRGFKSFQDPPTQKTYSGDVLLKHTHRFTPEKPFTPRTLKSHHQSTLLQYRYYTPPRRKVEEEKPSSIIAQETRQRSTRSKQGFSPQLESLQASLRKLVGRLLFFVLLQTFALDHEWSDEESFRHHGKTNRFKDSDFLLSSSRVSPEGMRSPIMRKVSAEEEELMYLEFITDVTNDILAQGLYSDRVLKRLFERHIDMNRHRLDENKMRHLLDNLQMDLQSPPAASIPMSLGAEEKRLPSDDVDYLLHDVFNEDRGQIEDISSAVASTPVDHSLDEEFLSDNVHLPCAGENPRNEVLEQVDELGKIMAESLSVSETQREVFEPEQTRGDVSDDEF